jgi:hypothetical protein
VGACGYVLSCQALNGAKLHGPARSGTYLVLESPGCDRRGPESAYREDLQWFVAGEILIVRGYCDGREGWYELFLGLILFFMLVAPPLQSGVVGPYSVRGAWFPNRLPLVGRGGATGWAEWATTHPEISENANFSTATCTVASLSAAHPTPSLVGHLEIAL